MVEVLSRLCAEDRGQDIAEYAVMLAVILVILVGNIRLIGANANNCSPRWRVPCISGSRYQLAGR
jgi:Flp pilus assembly pilin Flp